MAGTGWARGRQRNSPETNSRGGATPEKAESGLPVADSGRGWALEHARGTSKPLGHSSGRCGVRGGARGGGGGSAQRSSPMCGAPAATEGYGLRNCVQKVRGKWVGAHRGSNRAETSVGSWRRNSAAAHGRSRGRSSRSGWHWTPPGSWVARTVTRWRCEAEQRVREG